jgi:alpha-1,6-mannosyltransferase
MRDHLVDWGVERAVVQPLGVDTRPSIPRAPRRPAGAPRSASPPTRGARLRRPLRPREASRRPRRRGGELGRRTCCWRSAPGRRRRRRRARAQSSRSSPTSPALAAILAGADAFVHAGDQETFGLSALEAMACGTPIVVRKAEGLAELADGRSGLAVEHGSGAAFADAIARDARRRPAAQRRAARERAEAYDWERSSPASSSLPAAARRRIAGAGRFAEAPASGRRACRSRRGDTRSSRRAAAR